MLKIELIQEHVKTIQAQGYEVVMHIGYDLGDFQRGRTESTTRNWQSLGCTASYPLIDAMINNPRNELKTLGLIEPRSYSYGFKHANCIGQGGCVKFGQLDMITMYKLFPERYAERERVENTIRIKQGTSAVINALVLSLWSGYWLPVLELIEFYAHVRDMTTGTGYITLTQLRERFEQVKDDVKQLRLFEFEADLSGCSTECGVGAV